MDSPLSQLSAGSSKSSVKLKGICSVCKSKRQLHLKDGLIHLHGPRNRPCPGSHQSPLSILSQSSPHVSLMSASHVPCNFFSAGASPANPLPNPQFPASQPISLPSQPACSSAGLDFCHPRPGLSTIKHIPKGARTSVGSLLISILSSVLSASDPLPWRNLFSFAPLILAPPPRGGRRHNVSSLIKKRVSEFAAALTDGSDSLFSKPSSPLLTQNSKKKSQAQLISAAVSSKLEDGNIKAAARILCSDEAPVPADSATFRELVHKHPCHPPTRPAVPPPFPDSALQVDSNEVLKHIRSFPPGSSGGPDGLRPQHIAELIACPDIGVELLKAITNLTNLLLSGSCPPSVRPFLFGGKLFALRKKSGGLRPIAIGYYWRRLASKCANAFGIKKVASILFPHQIGVGIPGGCEAAIHATRRFLSNLPQNQVCIKLDFSNAFNSLYRDCIQDRVNELIPEISSYCFLSYAEASILQFGEFQLSSQVGPQQGDPLGPLLFCLPLQKVLVSLSSPLAFSYLDDVTLGGPAEIVSKDIKFLEQECSSLGLNLNRSKCELIAHSPVPDSTFDNYLFVTPGQATLLGAPLSESEALSSTLEHSCFSLSTAFERLSLIERHDALILLRYSLCSSKLLHILRCSPCHGHSSLSNYDAILHSGISSLFNISLSDTQFLQASLPVKFGGLGIRRVSSLANPAFLASAAGTTSLQSSLLADFDLPEDPLVASYLETWSSLSQVPIPSNPSLLRQSAWDGPLVKRDLNLLFDSFSDPKSMARLRAVSAPHASDWLQALPITSCSTRLSNEAIRVAMGLRLGVSLCEPHLCKCGSLVDADGSHGLSCTLSTGRFARHAALNDIVVRALSRAGFPALKEPPGLSRTDGKRPDGLTLIPWRAGRSLVWDVTVADTLAASAIPSTSVNAGAAADHAAERKKVKYEVLSPSYLFVPLAFETLGPPNVECLEFFSTLGHLLQSATGDSREFSFLLQRLSCTIQRFNQVAFSGSFITIFDTFKDKDDPRRQDSTKSLKKGEPKSTISSASVAVAGQDRVGAWATTGKTPSVVSSLDKSKSNLNQKSGSELIKTVRDYDYADDDVELVDDKEDAKPMKVIDIPIPLKDVERMRRASIKLHLDREISTALSDQLAGQSSSDLELDAELKSAIATMLSNRGISTDVDAVSREAKLGER